MASIVPTANSVSAAAGTPAVETVEARSPATASTPSHPTVAVPINYFQCPMQNLVVLVSSMLQQLVDINDRFELNPEKLTRFHSRSPPAISIRDYLVRIVRFCSVEKSILITLVYFIDLLAKSYQAFSVTSLTVHRFLITAVTVASKGLCDTFCTNSHYARVGGLSPMELNLLEVEFLTRVDYNIVPTYSLLTNYYSSMVTRDGSIYGFDPSIPSTLQSTKTEIEEADEIAIALTKIVPSPPATHHHHELSPHQKTHTRSQSNTQQQSDDTPKKKTSSFKKSLTKLIRPTKRQSDQNPPGREAVDDPQPTKKEQTTPKRPRPLY